MSYNTRRTQFFLLLTSCFMFHWTQCPMCHLLSSWPWKPLVSYCLHGFAFCKTSCGWNSTVCCFFKPSKMNLSFLHIFLWFANLFIKYDRLIDLREWEGNNDVREEHHMLLTRDYLHPQPGHVPWLGIEPTTSMCPDWQLNPSPFSVLVRCSNQPSHTS